MHEHARQLIYRYMGNPPWNEIKADLDGDMAIPMEGSIVEHHGKHWRVSGIGIKDEPHGCIPVYTIILNDLLM